MSFEKEEMDVSKDEDVSMDDDDDDDAGDVDDKDNEDVDFDQETSSDSEDEEEEIDEEKQESELLELRELVKADPYNYSKHLNYIGLAQKYANLDHLRHGRQTMSEIFPLTEKLWLDWLRDELKLLSLATETKRDLSDLFERAVNDYLSVMIWIEYIQYRMSIDLSLNAIEELRNLFERALSHCANHLPDGGLLWAAYVEVEQAKFMALINNLNRNPNDDSKEKVLQEIEYILKLYQRQLSIPLRRMQTVYDEYNEFCQQFKEYLPVNYNDQFDLSVKTNFDQVIQQLKECEVFEQELEDTSRSLETYKRYIRFEKEPTRVQCLYERAIIDHCLDGDLWLSYIDFLEEKLPSSNLLRSVYERSLRNCPWIATLWIRYAEFMEVNQLANHSELKQIYDRALNADPTNLVSFIDLQLAYLRYRRRHYQEQVQSNQIELCETLKEEIRHACESACDQYQELFLTANNPKLFLKYNGQLELLWIHIELKCFQSIENARKIWNGPTLMSKSHNQMISNFWKNYYYMELSDGDDKHARRVLYRAMNNIEKLDYPNVICNLLLEHETLYGTIQQLKEAKDKLRQVNKKLVKEAKSVKQAQSKNVPTSKKQTAKEKKQDNKEKATKSNREPLGTKNQPIQSNGKSHDQKSESSPRKRKLSPDDTESIKKKSIAPVIDSEGFKIPPLPPLPPPSSSSTASSSSSSTISKTATKVIPSSDIDHLRTVFIANLAFDVQEEAIREAFISAGPVKEIRIVKHEWSGKSKGFGYVDFETTEAYQRALKLDNTAINGRPMYVNPYDPNKSASDGITNKFKYATTLEQNKLFISNLPFSTTKEEIENLFKQHGFNPKDARLVTFKSGKPKGLAYVEFKDANEASQAIMKLDKYELEGHAIKVAISNPPKRQEPSKLGPGVQSLITKVTSLGEAPKSSGPRGKGYSQISLVPRKVTTSSSVTSKSVSDSSAMETNRMNNDDFRKMLLSKK